MTDVSDVIECKTVVEGMQAHRQHAHQAALPRLSLVYRTHMRTHALLLACAIDRNVPPLSVAEQPNKCKISATAGVQSDINTAHGLPPKDLSNGQVRLPQSFTDTPNRPRPQRKILNFCVASAAFAALPCQDEKSYAGGVLTKVAPFVVFSHIIPILWTVLSHDRSRRDGLPIARPPTAWNSKSVHKCFSQMTQYTALTANRHGNQTSGIVG
jgi:hypothetical protein